MHKECINRALSILVLIIKASLLYFPSAWFTLGLEAWGDNQGNRIANNHLATFVQVLFIYFSA